MQERTGHVIFACIAYVISYCIAYIAVGSYDIGNAAISCVDPVAQHQNERLLSIVYDLSVLVGLFAMWLFHIRSIPGGILLGAIIGIGAGGVFVFGVVEQWLPAMFAVATLIASLSFALLRRPFLSAFLAVSIVFVSAQVAFFVVT